jgi:hypothetical protein
MQFTIEIPIKGKPYRMDVERVYEGESLEKFQVSAGGRSVVLSSNINIAKDKRRNNGKVEWKLIEGDPKNPEAFASMVLAIERYFTSLKVPVSNRK